MRCFVILAALAVAACSAAPQQAQQRTPSRTNCTPGESWKDDCNTCTCTNTGQAACTLALCLRKRAADEAPAAGLAEGQDCTPNARWMPDDCNTCICNSDGKAAACSLVGCVNSTAPATRRTCSPGAMWRESCNVCWCSDNGQAACTLKGCLDNEHAHHNHKRNAPEGEGNDATTCKGDTWMQDCNTCRCVNGAPACTKMFCVPTPAPTSEGEGAAQA